MDAHFIFEIKLWELQQMGAEMPKRVSHYSHMVGVLISHGFLPETIFVDLLGLRVLLII